MPFLNIIEQAARIYREIFSVANGFRADRVLEHPQPARTLGGLCNIGKLASPRVI